jgi:hypothetical protein
LASSFRELPFSSMACLIQLKQRNDSIESSQLNLIRQRFVT